MVISSKNNQYSKENILSYERTMGSGYMSAGGLKTTVETAKILEEILTSTKGGARILDIGCGIGGAAFYFAQTYGARVHGVDLNDVGIEMANAKAEELSLTETVKFEVLDASKATFDDGSFDIIYSRDALLHIDNETKKILFRNMHGWLRGGGMVCVTDYSLGFKGDTNEPLSDMFLEYLAKRDYHLLTPKFYKDLFVAAGFDEDCVISEDRDQWYCKLCQDEVDRVLLPGEGRDTFLAHSSEEDLNALIKTYMDKIQMTLRGDRSYVVLHATKTGSHHTLREAVANTYKAMSQEGYIMSCDGNVSARVPGNDGTGTDGTFLITPSGVMIPDLTPDKVVECQTLTGRPLPNETYKPSSEYNLHKSVYAARPDVGGIVHSHSIYASALACCRIDLPPSHYAVCELLPEFDFSSKDGGSISKPQPCDAVVKCAEYHTYGTMALSKATTEALGNNYAVIMANHGAIVVGATLEDAMYNQERLERECEIYWKSVQLSSVSPPKPLTLPQIQNLQFADSGYGQDKVSIPDEDLPAKANHNETSAATTTTETEPTTAITTTTTTPPSASTDSNTPGTVITNPIKGRCALITGASSGIGAAVASTLAAAGVNVCLAARRIDRISALATELAAKHNIQALAVETDVTNYASCQRAVASAEEAFQSKLDILVNNAGVMHYTYMKNNVVSEWQQTIDVNCTGMVNCLGAALPSLLSHRNGHVIAISSDAGRVVFPGLSVYSGSKFFVEALAKGLRLECAESHGLKVTSIQPGDCKTELSLRDTDSEAKGECAQTNMNREYWLDPEDVAQNILFALTRPDHVAVQEIMVEPKHVPA